MPKAFLLLPLLSLSLAAFGQRTELSLHLNSGMASFLSDAPNDQSLLVRYDWMYQTTYYANNPYGGRLGLSYGLAAQATRVTRGGVLFGLQTGYEVLRSRVSIRDYFAPRTTPTHPAAGTIFLEHHFLNAHPFAGYRVLNKAVALDVTAGPEAALILAAREKGKVTLDGSETITIYRRRKDIWVDGRVRLGITASYRRVGLSAGYSLGFINYTRNLVGVDRENYAQFIRIGASYRFK
jgi:hypothetical protein